MEILLCFVIHVILGIIISKLANKYCVSESYSELKFWQKSLIIMYGIVIPYKLWNKI